ncbi:hypothetical protein TL13_0712 [Streptococcus suis TL13]|nr:hypothetical protein TL13_0712 [Streptococcus suis TL13]
MEEAKLNWSAISADSNLETTIKYNTDTPEANTFPSKFQK